MANQKLTATYEGLDKIVKIILQLFFGWVIGGVYRIIRYTETKNIVTLVVGIICLLPGPDAVAWVVDIVTEAAYNRINILAD